MVYYMARFRVPTFNLTVNLFRAPSTFGDPPDATFKAVLSAGRRSMLALVGPSVLGSLNLLQEVMELMCPAGTDIRGTATNGLSDMVEVPAGSSRFYPVLWVDDIGKGFPNEYRLGVIIQLSNILNGTAAFQAAFNGYPSWPSPTP
jgi:hypothetical protein